MKYLLMNASPQLEGSNSLVLAKAFLEGSGWKDIEYIDLYKLKIGFCRGCFSCWTNSPGQCVLQDDWNPILKFLSENDCTCIFSFPLYTFAFPAILKAALDRRLPMCDSDIVVDEKGYPHHPSRYPDRITRYVFISSCGFPVVHGNYEGLREVVRLEFRGLATELYCPMGGILKQDALPVQKRLELFRRAGGEYARTGAVSKDIQEAVSQPVIPIELYTEQAKQSFAKRRKSHV